MTAKTMTGLEKILADELLELDATDVTILQRAVSFRGNKKLMYKANLWCRTALRILKPVAEFNVNNEDDLYKKIYDINWEDYLDIDGTLTVDTVISGQQADDDSQSTNNNQLPTNSLYISQKTKDAIVDRFNKLQGRRPSVDIHNPDLRINIHISRNHCNVSLDSSGMSLHKRGYRQKTGLAPINEVLAAGLILLSGWKMDCNFIDPMCGSGTFLIEAAMLANNIPPGFYRREFGFQRWKDFDKDLWDKILKDSLKLQTEFPYQIIGSDISEKTIDIASENIVFARLHKDIVLQPSSFEDFNPPAEKGFLIMNPPYGERLVEEKIIDLYKSIGDILKKKYNGYQAWIISSDFDALKFIGLKPSRKIHIFNGPLECKFCKFEVYEGSKKAKKNYK